MVKKNVDGKPTTKRKAIKASEKITSGETQPLRVVGIGTSAGGLEAIEQFFSNMAPDTGLAFVIVPHLSPTAHSAMPEILSRFTKMKIQVVSDGLKTEPDCIYLIPPNKIMGIQDGSFYLQEPARPPEIKLPIDFFLRSLAKEKGPDALAIILSGTGSDGTLGLKEVKAQQGTVMVQTPESAKYDGMPRSAVDTGLADFVLTPGQMPQTILQFTRHTAVDEAEFEVVNDAAEKLQNIFAIMRNRTGHDFSGYKRSTFSRRLKRRMSFNRIGTISEYTSFLQGNENETKALLKDLLISVTSFFRDPEAFEALKAQLKEQLKNKADGMEVRVWVAGCATGEEAYSIAIVIAECLDELEKTLHVQIYGTDIDIDALRAARAGKYPVNIEADVSPERLKRFFVKGDDTYIINKEIREMTLFAPQDLIKDPPFSKMDLIGCRNLLIYMESEVQKKLLPLLHYALNPGGILFLGTSETTGESKDLFSTLDGKWKIFRRREVCVATGRLKFPTTFLTNYRDLAPEVTEAGIPQLTEKIFLDNYAPTFAVIDEKFRLVYVHGRTGKFLEISSGLPNQSILDMAREGLKTGLASAIYQATSEKQMIMQEGVRVKHEGGVQTLNLTVAPLLDQRLPPGLMIVVFQELGPIAEKANHSPGKGNKRITELEKELDITRETLQATIEELQSTNEELQSNNEELQSTNEELDTSSEELQSVNEELITLNAELQDKNESLRETKDYLNNLLDHANAPIIVWDPLFRITQFNHAFERLTGRTAQEVIGHGLEVLFPPDSREHSMEHVRRALVGEHMEIEEMPVQQKDGSVRIVLWNSATIFSQNGKDVVAAIAQGQDITERKKTEEALQTSRRLLQEIIDGAPNSIFVKDLQGRFITINAQLEKLLGLTRDEIKGKTDYDIVSKSQADNYRENDRSVAENDKPLQLAEEAELADGRRHYFLANKFPLHDIHGKTYGVASISTDLTEFKKAEETLKASEENYRNLFNNMSEGFAVCEMVYDQAGKPVDFRFLNTNPFFEKLLGLPRDQITGKTILELVPNVNPKAIENFGKVMSTGEPVFFENYSRDLKKWFDNYAYQSNQTQFGYIVLDITERKKAEEELKESEARFRSVLDNSRDVIYRTNLRTGRYEYLSPSTEAILGYSAAELEALDPITSLAMIHPEDLPTFRLLMGHLEKTGRAEGEYRLQTKKGGYLWVSNRLSIVKDSAGRPLYRDGIFRDITERKKMESQLQESEELYRALVDLAPDAILVHRNGEIRYGNAAAIRLFGASSFSELAAHNIFDLIHPEDRNKARASTQFVEQGHVTEMTERRAFRINGQEWTMEAAGTPVLWKGEKCVQGIIRDITERKKAEEEIKQTQERFKVLIENLRSGVALIDESGQFSLYNSSFLRMFGLSKDSDILSVNNQKWSDWKVYEEDGKTLLHVDEHPVRKAAMTGKPARNKVVGVRLPSGGDLIWMVINAEPIINPDGTLQYIIVTYYDITERKNVEEQLRNRAEELETVMNLVPVAIWVAHDPACHNITGNQKANEFYEAEEGENVSAGPASGEPVPPRRFFRNGKELTAEELPMQESAAQNQAIQGSEFNVILPSGRSLTLWGSASPLRNDDGQVRGVVAAFLDITERKQAEENLKHYTAELEAANKELESYSYSISHDLRTPLRTLDGFSEMVIEEYGDKLDKTGKEYLNRIRKAGQTMSQLTEDILKLSRVTRAEMHRDKVNLSKMAGIIADELRTTQPERQAEFIIAPDIIVNGDKALLEIMLRNLLDNSWKYTGKCANARIEMGISKRDGKDAYFIKDNGVGFDMQYKDKLFQPFQRLHSSKDYPGTGIGLATAQRVIRRHGGDIWVESEIDKGTTFYFTLE